MKLNYQSSADDLCVLCQMAEANPEREDGLCDECGSVADSYSEPQESLELDD